MKKEIRFYLVNDCFGEFSNFAPYPILLDGKIWPTAEHYFQAQKFAGTPYEEEIRLVESPMQAAKMGRDRNRPLRPDWDAVKIDIMRSAVHAKFSQNDGLRHLLIETGDAILIEHTTNDSFWGDGGGSGKNMLGLILMEVRSDLALFEC